MNLEAVPKSFWHSASFALLAFTIGFLFISYKYGDLTVKFNELEIRATNTNALEQSLSKQEASLLEQGKIIKEREKEIDELAFLLDKKAKELEEVKKELASFQTTDNSEKAKSVLSKLERASKDDGFTASFRAKKEILDELKNQQKKQIEHYDQQRNIYTMQQQQQLKWK